MSSGFVTETELAERQKIRQEEWNKVRTADQPLVVPEEQYDHRSLFDRLEEQRRTKEYEYEETHKLKNMIRGLDDDEIDFLELVDKTKMAQEKRQIIEETRQIEEFRTKVNTLQYETAVIPWVVTNPKPYTVNSGVVMRNTQSKLLAGAVVKKRTSDENTNNILKKQKTKESTENTAGQSKYSIFPGLAYSDSSDNDSE